MINKFARLEEDEMNTDYQNKNKMISLLKIASCYLVVANHFGTGAGLEILNKVNACAMGVPIFAFLSFYLTSSHFYDHDVKWLGKRLKRLYLPVACWSVIYFVIYNLFRYLLKMELISFKELGYSVITGVSEKLNTPMWFNITMILLTAFLFSVIVGTQNVNKRYFLFVLLIIFIVCQYNGFNTYFFSSAPLEIRGTLGRFNEMAVFGILGLMYGRNYREFSNGIKAANIALWIAILGVSFFIPMPEGFGYQGIRLMAQSVVICVLFISIPNIEKQSLIWKIIIFVSEYTMGVYFIHIGIGWALTKVLEKLGISTENGLFAMVVFLISLLMVILIDRCLPKKLNLSFLVK